MTRSPVIERFLSLVGFDTQSVETAPGQEARHPSSPGQEVLATHIKEQIASFPGFQPEMLTIFADGSFVVQIPASQGFEGKPHVAFAAHLDTYYNFSGATKPIIRVNYSGGDITLPNGGTVITAEDLKGLEGKTIITSDGGSVLGSDDKAGVAAIIEVLKQILEGNGGSHGPLTFWFCVDEEIGQLDISVLPEDLVKSWAILWTVDGSEVGKIDIGCFVCRKIFATFKGVDSHPGEYGKKLKPAHYAAIWLAAAIGTDGQYLTPMETSGLESFHYVTSIEGNASKATVILVPRTFDKDESEEMAKEIRELAERAATEYGVEFTFEDKLMCGNTVEGIEANRPLVQVGVNAHEGQGFEVIEHQCRGGTDGAMINMKYPDLPAPNMGHGGRLFHGPSEFLVVEELEAVPNIIMDMIAEYAVFAE
ncbi:MAG: M20/M25/M40 family metallo-hydrolase [Patescibacteria group bacterium]